MMASNSALGLSVCRELSQNLRVVCVSPETTHDPKARSRSPRRGVLQDCGAVVLQGRYTTEGSYFSRDY